MDIFWLWSPAVREGKSDLAGAWQSLFQIDKTSVLFYFGNRMPLTLNQFLLLVLTFAAVVVAVYLVRFLAPKGLRPSSRFLPVMLPLITFFWKQFRKRKEKKNGG